ncbi:MAG: Sbal_3080 family lipoprotein [Sulfurimonas sp.]|nr:Sbal_3080 family lipoprotein [Sulfurimonas sp.]
MSIVLFSGCSTMLVEAVDKKHALEYVCIENNPKVIVDDFIPVVENIFHEHGIATDVYDKDGLPKSCKIKMTYTALQTWDITTFLAYAEIHLFKGMNKIGYAEYDMIGKGGLDLSKWSSVKTKMTPVIEKLLAQYEKREITFNKNIYKKEVTKANLTLEEKLVKLKKMKDDSLITDDEYLRKKQQLLSDY